MSTVDPASLDYAFAPDFGECWRAATMPPGSDSGAAFIYCPAGAPSGDEYIDGGDASVLRAD